MVRAIKLKVAKAPKLDVKQNIVRLDEKCRKKLGVELYDAVVLMSDCAVWTSVVKQARKRDTDKKIARLDQNQRDRLGVDLKGQVTVLNYMDYKIEEENLKPEPFRLGQTTQTIQVGRVGELSLGDVTKIKDSVIQRSTVGGGDKSGNKTGKKKGKVEIKDSVVQRSSIGGKDESGVFNNCPFCGKHFTFKKNPEFCPYCNEELT